MSTPEVDQIKTPWDEEIAALPPPGQRTGPVIEQLVFLRERAEAYRLGYKAKAQEVERDALVEGRERAMWLACPDGQGGG